MESDTKPQLSGKPFRLGNKLVIIHAGKDDTQETFILHADAVRQAFPNLIEKIAIYHAGAICNTAAGKQETDASKPETLSDCDSDTSGSPTPTPSQSESETHQHEDGTQRQVEVLTDDDHISFVLPDEDPDSIALLGYYVYRGSFPEILRREKTPAVLPIPFADIVAPAGGNPFPYTGAPSQLQPLSSMVAPAPLTLADLGPGASGWRLTQGVAGTNQTGVGPYNTPLSEWFAHVCTRPEYTALSPEELRLRDYLVLGTKMVNVPGAPLCVQAQSTIPGAGTGNPSLALPADTTIWSAQPGASSLFFTQPTATSIVSGQSTTSVGETISTRSPPRSVLTNTAATPALFSGNVSVTTRNIATATQITDGVAPRGSKPQTTESRATEPQTTKSLGFEFQVTESQATESQAPERQVTQATEAQGTESQPTEATEPQATKSQGFKFQVFERRDTEATELQVTQVQGTKCQTTEATESQATESEASKPQASEPQHTDSQAMELKPTASQVQLLGLALFAERVGCDKLFNVATDTYRKGESEGQVWEEDVEMVWKPSHKNCPVLKDMLVSRILLGASIGQSDLEYEWIRQFNGLEQAVMGKLWKLITARNNGTTMDEAQNGAVWGPAGAFRQNMRKHHIHDGTYYEACTKCGWGSFVDA